MADQATKWYEPFEDILKWFIIIILATILWWLTGVGSAVAGICNWASVQFAGIPAISGIFRFFSQHNWLATVIFAGIIYLVFWGRRRVAGAGAGAGAQIADQTIKLVDHFVIKPIWWVITTAICLLNVAIAVMAIYVLDPNAPAHAVLSKAGKGALFGIAICICGLLLASFLGWTKSENWKTILVGIYVVSIVVCLWRVYAPPKSRTAKAVSGRAASTGHLLHDIVKSDEPVGFDAAIYSARDRLILMQINAHAAALAALERKMDPNIVDPKFLDPNFVSAWQRGIDYHAKQRASLSAQLEQNKLSPGKPEGQKKGFAAIAVLIVILLVVAALFKWAVKGKTARTCTAVISVLILGVIFWYNFGLGKISWLSRPRSYEVLSLRGGIGESTERFFSPGEVAKVDVLKGKVQYKNLKLDPSKIYTFKIRTPGKLYFEGVEGGGKVKVMYR